MTRKLIMNISLVALFVVLVSLVSMSLLASSTEEDLQRDIELTEQRNKQIKRGMVYDLFVENAELEAEKLILKREYFLGNMSEKEYDVGVMIIGCEQDVTKKLAYLDARELNKEDLPEEVRNFLEEN